MNTVILPGPSLAHGIPYLLSAERDRDVEPDGVMDPMFYADMKAAVSAVGARGSASAVDTVGGEEFKRVYLDRWVSES